MASDLIMGPHKTDVVPLARKSPEFSSAHLKPGSFCVPKIWNNSSSNRKTLLAGAQAPCPWQTRCLCPPDNSRGLRARNRLQVHHGKLPWSVPASFMSSLLHIWQVPEGSGYLSHRPYAG